MCPTGPSGQETIIPLTHVDGDNPNFGWKQPVQRDKMIKTKPKTPAWQISRAQKAINILIMPVFISLESKAFPRQVWTSPNQH